MDVIIEVLKTGTQIFGLFVALGYQFIKLIVRIGLHNLIQEKNKIQNLPLIVWAMVDLGFLASLFFFNSSLPNKLGFSQNGNMIWMLFPVICVLVSCYFYAMFMKTYTNKSKN